MIIRVKKNSDIPSSEITPESIYIDRRKFLGASAGIGAATLLGAGRAHAASQDDEPNTWEEITSYNNFYEFGTAKGDPAKNAPTGSSRTRGR